MVAEIMADKKMFCCCCTWWPDKKKLLFLFLADMEVDMVANKEIDKVADMVTGQVIGVG